ncbi:N-6 DNA methylase [Helicobacter pylori]|uniref:Eco57I restriction-modification methylase domain-containing protein n=1 Tax=Helicobacter pylori TaxID=210 RepID=UPI001ABA6E8D|nr:N-6 DNA methylase [Helicobacter pylori]WRE13981.1 N-6 DNA methylase [Helicobacter pylori]
MMTLYNFSQLDKKQTKIYNDFLFKLSSANSPLNQQGSENDLAHIFENELNALLRGLSFTSSNYENFRHENNNAYGRTDFQYGNTIIEYKKYNRLKNEKETHKASEQIKNYLKDERFNGFKMFGFLFDGASVHAYIKETNNEITYKEEYSGSLNARSLDFFIKSLFNSGLVNISPTNFKKDFGIIDTDNKLLDNHEIRNLAKFFFNTLKDEKKLNARSLLLFKEWEKLFRLAENDNGKHQDIKDRREVFSLIFDTLITKDNEYKAFFALHSTLSVIIKLLLARFINDKSHFIVLANLYKTDKLLEVKNFFESIEQGKFFKKMGIINLTDNDFFAWYIKEEFTTPLKNALQKLLFKVCAYEDIEFLNHQSMLDLFKELYLNFIPKVVRHSFGEYYTPYYLAERTLLCAIKGKEHDLKSKSFIDPNCGSGTFLCVFINYKHRNLEKKIDFKTMTQGIVGIDINPIAVLMARANMLIFGLKHCHFDLNATYEIPIYLADSLYVPQTVMIDHAECLYYKLYTAGLQQVFDTSFIEITLPKKLVLKPDFLEIIHHVEKALINLDKQRALEILEEESADIQKSKALNEKISQSLDNLIAFEKKGLNSIWLKIFSNYFKVAIYDKFDFIVGNPAWVQWSVLPETYRKNVKENIRLNGLFSRDKNVGGNNLNICALIANKSIERWLKDDGVFCFLMPKSILFNKSFEGFRDLRINSLEQVYFNEILDFSKAGEIFEGVGLDFCAFKITKQPLKNKDIVPLLEYERLPNQYNLNANLEWDKVKESFRCNKNYALALNTEVNNNFLITDNLQRAEFLKTKLGMCEYTFRKGVSVHCLMRLEFVDFFKDDFSRGVFHPYIKVNNRLRVDTSKKIILELDFIKPFISAPMLEEQAVKWTNSYVIFPYLNNQKQPLKPSDLKKLAPFTYKYLCDIDEHLNKGSDFNSRVQNLKENYGILRIGSYVYANHFVCIRDNTKLAPCYISLINTHWGKAMTPLFDNHISYISERPVKLMPQEKYEPITQDEALYILEKLLDKDNQEIILKSQDSRSISSRLPIELPLFTK